MDKQDLIRKLIHIEEHAKSTLSDFPGSLAKSRLQMIVALAGYVRMEIAVSESANRLDDAERHASENDDSNPAALEMVSTWTPRR